MQRLEVSGAVRPLYWSLGVNGLNFSYTYFYRNDYLHGYQQPQTWTHQRLNYNNNNNNHKINHFVIERASKYLFVYINLLLKT